MPNNLERPCKVCGVNIVVRPKNTCVPCKIAAKLLRQERATAARAARNLALTAEFGPLVTDGNTKHRAKPGGKRANLEAARMDAIVRAAWQRADAYQRTVIAALNPRMVFEEVAG